MKIMFDCRYTRIERHDGISRFSASLVASLAKKHEVTMLISDVRQLAMLPDLPWQKISSPTSAKEPLVAKQINRFKPDIVFSPMQTMGSWGRKYALVLTVHDLIYYRHRTPPKNLNWAIRVLWRLYHLSWVPQRILLNRADAVVTVSETTKNLIAKHRLSNKAVHVVANATDFSATSCDAVTVAPRKKSLIYMGSFMPYKNVETLVRAMPHLPGYELHLMSKISDVQKNYYQNIAPNAKLVFHNGSSDEEYQLALTQATALVSASKDEGFGIPLIEAMALGTPVVVSDITIFREIGGSGALYFKADNPVELALKIRKLEQEEYWQKLSTQAKSQAKKFT